MVDVMYKDGLNYYMIGFRWWEECRTWDFDNLVWVFGLDYDYDSELEIKYFLQEYACSSTIFLKLEIIIRVTNRYKLVLRNS